MKFKDTNPNYIYKNCMIQYHSTQVSYRRYVSHYFLCLFWILYSEIKKHPLHHKSYKTIVFSRFQFFSFDNLHGDNL